MYIYDIRTYITMYCILYSQEAHQGGAGGVVPHGGQAWPPRLAGTNTTN